MDRGLIGADAAAALSAAVCKAGAAHTGRPLYAHVAALAGGDRLPKLPTPVFVMLRGGVDVPDNDLLFEQVGVGAWAWAWAWAWGATGQDWGSLHAAASLTCGCPVKEACIGTFYRGRACVVCAWVGNR